MNLSFQFARAGGIDCVLVELLCNSYQGSLYGGLANAGLAQTAPQSGQEGPSRGKFVQEELVPIGPKNQEPKKNPKAKTSHKEHQRIV